MFKIKKKGNNMPYTVRYARAKPSNSTAFGWAWVKVGTGANGLYRWQIRRRNVR